MSKELEDLKGSIGGSMATLPRSDHAQGFVHHINVYVYDIHDSHVFHYLTDVQLSKNMNLMTRGKHECWVATQCAIVSYPTISIMPRENTGHPSKWAVACNSSEIPPRAANVSAASLSRSVCGLTFMNFVVFVWSFSDRCIDALLSYQDGHRHLQCTYSRTPANPIGLFF